MCQLCAIRDLASRDRWPKPLEENVQEILNLLPTAHKEVTNYLAWQDALRKTKPSTDQPKAASEEGSKAAYNSLVQTLDMLETLFNLLSEARIEWWNSPPKKQQRREWSASGETAKLTQLQKVNQKSIDMIADMAALVGRFRTWSLESSRRSGSDIVST